MTIPRVMIAGQCSGIGKSTITAGILMALKERGHRPQPFKAGPDFLDPMHHTIITGRTCRNLDTWMFPDAVPELFQRSSQGAGISVLEGVMGFYDGLDGISESGSSSHLSKVLRCPVILVVDASGSARSVGAVVEGFRSYDLGTNIAGVIVNRCGSERHFQMVKESIRGIPVIGGLRNRDDVELKSRHLGLVPAEEQFNARVYDNIRNMVEESLDLDMLMDIASSAPELDLPEGSIFGDGQSKARIGVAKDEAFNFYYQDNLDLLESYGAELVYFSPLRDRMPDVDGLYIGGGFPELFASGLAENESLRQEIRECSQQGMPIYAECGGLMYLCGSMTDMDGKEQPMVGVFDAKASMTSRLQALGYVEVMQEKDGLLGPAGSRMRGHEFHYSLVEADVKDAMYSMQRGKGIAERRDGLRMNMTQASYTHLHFGSCPWAAKGLVDSCQGFQG